MKKSALAIFAILLSCMLSYAGQAHHFFVHYSNTDGLPTSIITSCCQDDFGRIWIGTSAGVFYYAGTKFVPLVNEDYLERCYRNTYTLAKDNDGCIWISTNNGSGYYDPRLDAFTYIDGTKAITINDIDIAGDGTVWLTADEGIWKYRKQDGSLALAVPPASFSPRKADIMDDGSIIFTAGGSHIYIYDETSDQLKAIKCAEDAAELGHIIYLGQGKALVTDGPKKVLEMDIADGSIRTMLDKDVIENMAETYCLLAKDGKYWVGTSYGLIIYDPSDGSIERQFPDILDEFTLGAESVRCLYEDTDGNVWAGTYSGGLRGWMSYENDFKRYRTNESSESIAGETIRAICKSDDGAIWIGSEEGYICRMDPATGKFRDYTKVSGIPYGTAVTDMKVIGQDIWICTYGGGIMLFSPESGRTVKKYTIPGNSAMQVLKCSDGNIYLACTNGLYRLDPGSDSFSRVEVAGTSFIHSFMEDANGHLILGQYYQPLGIYDLSSGSFKTATSFPTSGITGVCMDSHGYTWIPTDGSGLFRILFSKEGEIKEIDCLDKNAGMPSNSFSSVTESKDGMLWFATNSGLVEFDPVQEKIVRICMQNDNVLGANFTHRGNFLDEDGTIFLGTNKGLLEFRPGMIDTIFRNSHLHITNITLGTLGGSRPVSEQGRSAITTSSLVLKQKDAAYLSISFSSMNYGSPNTDVFRCTLSGFGFNSELTTEDNFIAYTSLKPGKYQFSVNYANGATPGTAAGLEIVIKAPILRSTVAKIFYVALLFMLMALIARQVSQRKEDEAKHRLELLEINREKDLVHEKMDFFTNIAHEIRTPVTVLQILTDKLQGMAIGSPETEDDIKAIGINVDRLRKLCDNLLDFRKVESGQTTLVFSREDIRSLCTKTLGAFASAADSKGISIHEDFPEGDFMVSCDSEATESILCNLLSNAVKYCSGRIDFILAQDADKITVRVTSDGKRIPEDERELIFDAFYQSKAIDKAGTGLGLTYSRMLADMHQGRLFLDTDIKDGNSFVLELPRNAKTTVTGISLETTDDSRTESEDEEDTSMADTGKRATILLAEDNDSMRSIIKGELAGDYDIIEACDGIQALEKIRSCRVDLVVSDIMMPGMDGCELCNAIKEDIQYSHIPVLLLTAAVGIDTHIRSLKSGADGYIEKPFKMEILKASIANLFKNMDIRNEQFSSSPLSHMNFSSVSKVEHEFMSKLHGFITENISDTELTITRLATVMSVSKPTLTRKVKANTGLTVNEYVRICRLKKAVELLAENTYRISEVAYLVGYTSPSYFTQSFQKQFGKLPSEFTKNNQK